MGDQSKLRYLWHWQYLIIMDVDGDKKKPLAEDTAQTNKDNINPYVPIKFNCQEYDSPSVKRSSLNIFSKSNVSLCSPNQPPKTTSPSLMTKLFENFGNGRNRSISESEVDQARVSSPRVDVDLTPWLKHGDNAHTLQVARLRRNSSREVEEALAGGLSKADIHMPSL